VPRRPCLKCGQLVEGASYCHLHRGTGARGSTRAWRKLRAAVIARDGGCVVCGVAGPLEVHHVLPMWRGGTDHPSNLEARCHAHHERGGG